MTLSELLEMFGLFNTAFHKSISILFRKSKNDNRLTICQPTVPITYVCEYD